MQTTACGTASLRIFVGHGLAVGVVPAVGLVGVRVLQHHDAVLLLVFVRLAAPPVGKGDHVPLEDALGGEVVGADSDPSRAGAGQGPAAPAS